MKVLLRLVCLIAVLISSLEADMCEERAERVILVSSAYEIDVRSCLLNPNERKGTIIWYKNDSKTPVSMEVDSRIHQHEDKLWFVPAKVEDSGHYYCAVRNSTYCLKVKITIKFVQHEPNLCYNTEAIFTQKLPVAADGQLVCPYMEFFKDEKNGLPEMQWHKDCKPLLLDNINFTGVTDRLIIANVTAAHEGKYTCGTFYTYLGKRYPITRVIELITIEEYKPVRPVIVSPANETMEAGLGSKLQLICNVSGHISDYVYWKWNGSSIDEEDSVLAEDYVPVENPPKRRKNTIITILNISEVESRFYLHPFTCVAKNTEGLSSAYIQLIHPVPDFRKHTIGVFVMLTVIITCSVFIYKIFKVDIVLWYRDSCYVLPKKASDGKTYDAYILYPKTPGEGSTSNSDIFVFKVLPEVLEEQCGYKLFIYGRDAYVGEDIVEVTNENIRKSRRLIIVLVPEASGLGCLGNSSEEQIAMYNAFVQDGIKVVLLELEKIQDYEKMPETIKFIKQKHGAIRWSGDFREGSQSAKTRFWKNVRYHMPVQRQPPSSRPQFLSLATRPDSKKTLQREVQVPLG
ncbi:interleukin-1 receptor type 1 isoform X1 [Ursus americanus]|uniref:interleukin-1 receptor type 1 isoform X1 n=1 Tax=Ursus americanus TaxID=9643 RepID=UPI001E67A1E5|nr:interleukin-1 receptor type 1 isoform X1 [Ursus americanus]XP_045627531.1 interleukin-1 receptor type 1 isoform X1 [Ursus americanus]XP_045627533.1 interleukin-1 receptor type 1 isoform X1 [Ursus americanus]XP_045627534.1 interleukin-1 receptor type 1 isoform X1 [Ursus americanus]XP_045627535.1 interleukin-1 receptor type 1 isoform X1 [Ursus americanus]XP_045627536.1 interleukin-1 receptor type 1 isoform X1 [Ursus americanus]XP_045627537.1 interleukin-1 receptor type 1 isoform X1 [Ursus am